MISCWATTPFPLIKKCCAIAWAWIGPFMSNMDGTAMLVSFIGVSMPNFWLGPLLILLFAIQLDWTLDKPPPLLNFTRGIVHILIKNI